MRKYNFLHNETVPSIRGQRLMKIHVIQGVNYITMHHYSDITWWSWCLNSPATLLLGVSTNYHWIPPTKGQWCVNVSLSWRHHGFPRYILYTKYTTRNNVHVLPFTCWLWLIIERFYPRSKFTSRALGQSHDCVWVNISHEYWISYNHQNMTEINRGKNVCICYNLNYHTSVRLGLSRCLIISVMASPITSLTIVYSTVYSGADQREHQSSTTLAFVRGIHQWPVNSPHKWPVTRKMSPFDDVIMCATRPAVNMKVSPVIIHQCNGNTKPEVAKTILHHILFILYDIYML